MAGHPLEATVVDQDQTITEDLLVKVMVLDQDQLAMAVLLLEATVVD